MHPDDGINIVEEHNHQEGSCQVRQRDQNSRNKFFHPCEKFEQKSEEPNPSDAFESSGHSEQPLELYEFDHSDVPSVGSELQEIEGVVSQKS
jgi:hypothetical protein